MAAKKEYAVRKTLLSRGANGALGAARIRNQRVTRNLPSNFGQSFDGQPNRQSNVNQVRSLERLLQARLGLIHDTQLERAFEHAWFVPAYDTSAGKCLPHR
jgi:hypothetical protein